MIFYNHKRQNRNEQVVDDILYELRMLRLDIRQLEQKLKVHMEEHKTFVMEESLAM